MQKCGVSIDTEKKRRIPQQAGNKKKKPSTPPAMRIHLWNVEQPDCRGDHFIQLCSLVPRNQDAVLYDFRFSSSLGSTVSRDTGLFHFFSLTNRAFSPTLPYTIHRTSFSTAFEKEKGLPSPPHGPFRSRTNRRDPSRRAGCSSHSRPTSRIVGIGMARWELSASRSKASSRFSGNLPWHQSYPQMTSLPLRPTNNRCPTSFLIRKDVFSVCFSTVLHVTHLHSFPHGTPRSCSNGCELPHGACAHSASPPTAVDGRMSRWRRIESRDVDEEEKNNEKNRQIC